MAHEQESPRENLGLAAADEGRVSGVDNFLSFVQGEVRGLGISTELPAPVRGKLLELNRDLDKLVEWLRGYQAAVIIITSERKDG